MRHACLIAALALGLMVAEQVKAAAELEQRAAIAESVHVSFLANDFDQLESVSRQYRSEKSRTSSGLWKLSLFYQGLDDSIKNQTKGEDRDALFEAIERRLRKWTDKFPDSPTGHIALSLALIDRAWAHRGGGYASTVTTEGWVQFERYIALARSNLEKFKSVALVDPEWYRAMLLIANADSWDRSDFDSLFNEALESEPLYYQTYFSALEYLMPKWHGSVEEIEDFAQDAVKRTKVQEGFGMYARIYWFASQTQFKDDLFNNSLVEWSQMKAGFEDVISRYPDAWNLNNYAKFACLAGDKPKTMELIKHIGSEVVAEAWATPLLRDKCAFWASQP